MHCGILRERVLAASDVAFGHRLMMDRIVPGGVAQDLTGDGATAIEIMLDVIEPRFAEIVRLYDDTPSLQDRTCNTGIVAPDLVANAGERAATLAAARDGLSMPAARLPAARPMTRSRWMCRSFPKAM